MTAKKQRGSRSSYWIFVLPALVMVFFSSILPLLFNFYYALFDWNGVSATMNFIGLQNFETMVSDTRFLRSISFTCRYMCISVVLTNGISLGLSVALSHAGKKLSNFGRAAYYVPCITSSVATGLMWKVIFRDGVDTLHAFTHLDIFAKSWIGAVDMAFYSILIVGIWGSVGFYNIIYIAALKSVPADTLEAALIDGATYWQRFWRVTFPQILPTTSVCVLLSLINGFKVFDPILLVTDGGPAGTTNSMAFNIYETAFARNKFGLASAEAILFMAVLIVLTAVNLKVTKVVSE